VAKVVGATSSEGFPVILAVKIYTGRFI